MSIKGTRPGIQSQTPASQPGNQTSKAQTGQTQSSSQASNPGALAEALRDYQKFKTGSKKNFLAGAAGLFTDNIVFPSDLMDPDNPENDPKYLHLLSAVLGMKKLKKIFMTDEQADEDEENNDDGENLEDDE